MFRALVHSFWQYCLGSRKTSSCVTVQATEATGIPKIKSHAACRLNGIMVKIGCLALSEGRIFAPAARVIWRLEFGLRYRSFPRVIEEAVSALVDFKWLVDVAIVRPTACGCVLSLLRE